MSFTCALHGWSHGQQQCPVCNPSLAERAGLDESSMRHRFSEGKRALDAAPKGSGQPFFTEEDFVVTGYFQLNPFRAMQIANAKIQPVLDKLAQLERNHAPVLERIESQSKLLVQQGKEIDIFRRERDAAEKENERLKADLENNIREKEEIVKNQDESRWAFWRKRAGELNDECNRLKAEIAASNDRNIDRMARIQTLEDLLREARAVLREYSEGWVERMSQDRGRKAREACLRIDAALEEKE